MRELTAAEKEQYARQEAETKERAEHYLSLLPAHTRSWLSYYAYEQGHSAGEQEVNSYIAEIGFELTEALRKDSLIK